MKLEGSSALVTGASSGIGRATCIELARRGVTIRATGRDDEALHALISKTGGVWLAADLREASEVDRVAEWASPVDILVNNAGVGWSGALSAMPLERGDEIVRLNLLAPVRLTALLLPAMIERGAGHVVNVASIAGHVGVAGEAAYAATKAGLIALSDSLRVEVAGFGIGVSVVSPGAVDTAFFERAGTRYERRFPRMVTPERVSRWVRRSIEHDIDHVFVPHWLAFPAWLHGVAPPLYRRLARLQ